MEKVWPYVLKTADWFTGYRFETISGKEGKEGHLMKVNNDVAAKAGVNIPYHFLKVEPFHIYVHKGFGAEGGGYGASESGAVTFYVTNVIAQGGKTTIILSVHNESPRGTITEAQFEDSRQKGEKSMEERMQRYWNNLKLLVEKNNGQF